MDFPIAVCELYRVALGREALTKQLDPSDWDAILCSISSWVQTIDESRDLLKHQDSQVRTLVRAFSSLRI